MRAKVPKVVASFRTTHDALGAEALCREAGIPGRIIPVPTEITAGCGFAYMMPPEERGLFLRTLEGKIEPEGLYEMMLRG